MSVLAALLRLFLLVAFALGVGLTAAPARAAAPEAQPHVMAQHTGCETRQPIAPDDLCRAHCLGLSMLPATAAPAPHRTRAAALPALPYAETAPSLWPLPEPHPPRL